MAIKYSCDGCGQDGTDFKARGLLNIKHYCSKCIDSVDAYLQARDDLHTQIAEAFSQGVVAMKNAWHKEYPKGKLPDES